MRAEVKAYCLPASDMRSIPLSHTSRRGAFRSITCRRCPVRLLFKSERKLEVQPFLGSSLRYRIAYAKIS